MWIDILEFSALEQNPTSPYNIAKKLSGNHLKTFKHFQGKSGSD